QQDCRINLRFSKPFAGEKLAHVGNRVFYHVSGRFRKSQSWMSPKSAFLRIPRPTALHRRLLAPHLRFLRLRLGTNCSFPKNKACARDGASHFTSPWQSWFFS